LLSLDADVTMALFGHIARVGLLQASRARCAKTGINTLRERGAACDGSRADAPAWHPEKRTERMRG